MFTQLCTKHSLALGALLQDVPVAALEQQHPLHTAGLRPQAMTPSHGKGVKEFPGGC